MNSAGRMLSPGEGAQWRSMGAVEKRRREWLLGRCVAKEAVRALLNEHLDQRLTPAEIEILTDPYGRPRVSAAVRPSISIAHSHGTAVALAALDEDACVGVDLESLEHHRQNFESVAFSADESSLLDTLPDEVRPEWALRMWCAKEAVGKALGRGLSAGLLAFHILSLDTKTGIIEVKLRHGALEQSPPWLEKSLMVRTAREFNFVFSAIIYQQGAARMRPSRQEILDYLLHKMGELTEDWDYTDPVGPE